MKQTVFTIVVVLIIVGLLSVVILGSRDKKTDTDAMQSSKGTSSLITRIPPNNQTTILFYGNTCPHCADAEKWIEQNKIKEIISVVKKEVYDNQVNANELAQVAKSCGLSTESIAVPFLYTPEGKCLIGTPDIVSYLSNKAGLPKNTEATSSKEGGKL